MGCLAGWLIDWLLLLLAWLMDVGICVICDRCRFDSNVWMNIFGLNITMIHSCDTAQGVVQSGFFSHRLFLSRRWRRPTRSKYPFCQFRISMWNPKYLIVQFKDSLTNRMDFDSNLNAMRNLKTQTEWPFDPIAVQWNANAENAKHFGSEIIQRKIKRGKKTKQSSGRDSLHELQTNADFQMVWPNHQAFFIRTSLIKGEFISQYPSTADDQLWTWWNLIFVLYIAKRHTTSRIEAKKSSTEEMNGVLDGWPIDHLLYAWLCVHDGLWPSRNSI